MDRVSQITKVRSLDFDDHSGETILLGNCSKCRELVIYQFADGWPAFCPGCGSILMPPGDHRTSVSQARTLIEVSQV
jgi:hypothetical protein